MLPLVFEEYFFKPIRKPNETLFEYVQRIHEATKKVSEFKSRLPEKVQGWLLLRRAGLTYEQRPIIITLVGKTVTFDNLASSMQLVLGQHQTMSERRARYVNLAEHAADDYYIH